MNARFVQALVSLLIMSLFPACSEFSSGLTSQESRCLKLVKKADEPYSSIVDCVRNSGVPMSRRFWLRVANDPEVPVKVRRLAVMQSFKQGFRPRMDLRQFRTLVAGLDCLQLQDFGRVEMLAGAVPVNLQNGDSVFFFDVFPTDNRKSSVTLYFLVRGDLSLDQFRDALHNPDKFRKHASLPVVEIGSGEFYREKHVEEHVNKFGLWIGKDENQK